MVETTFAVRDFYADDVQNHIKSIHTIGSASPEGPGSANWERGKVDSENIKLAEARAMNERASLVQVFKKLGMPYDAKTVEIAAKEKQLHWFSAIALTRLADAHDTDVQGLIEMVNTKKGLDAETILAVNNILEPMRNATVVIEMENDQSTSFVLPLSPLYLLLICIIRPEWCRRPPPPPGGAGPIPPVVPVSGVHMPEGVASPTLSTVDRLSVTPEKNPRDYMGDAHGRIVAQHTGYYETLFNLFSDEAAAQPHTAGAGLDNASDREIGRNRLARLLLDNWNTEANAIRAEAGFQSVNYIEMNDQRMDALILATTIQRLVEEGAKTESLSTYRELMLDTRVKELVFQDISQLLEEMYDRDPSLRANRPAGSARDLSA